MRLLKQAVGVLGTVVVMVVIATVVMPKTTHAIVSTLVTVVNTSANPVPTFPTEALNHFNVTSGCSFAGSFACDVNPIYNVPVGKTAVVEYVSGFCNTEAGTGIALLRLDTVPDNTSGFFVAGPSISLNGTNNINITSWRRARGSTFRQTRRSNSRPRRHWGRRSATAWSTSPGIWLNSRTSRRLKGVPNKFQA
jgi:hypothetical protein